MCQDFINAKILSSSIVSSLEILYTYSTMYSNNTLEDQERVDDVIFTIKAAAKQLSNMIDDIEENEIANQNLASEK